MPHPVDRHLATVAEIIDTIHVHNDHRIESHWTPVALADVLHQAVDAWLCDLSTEHNRSKPFATASHSHDRLLAVFEEFAAALAYLRARGDTVTTFASALEEALEVWLINHRPDMTATAS